MSPVQLPTYYTPSTYPVATPPNKANPSSSTFYPLVEPSVGTLLDAKKWKQNENPPMLFEEVEIGEMKFKNRIFVAPMCQYSASQEESQMGVPTPWHLVHLGSMAVRGAALVMTEATAVLPNGRNTPSCLGLWNDVQRDSFASIFSFIRAQGARAGIQLNHAGRKASTLPEWVTNPLGEEGLKTKIATTKGEAGGWEDVWAPSRVAHGVEFPLPKEMTLEEIEVFKEGWREAVRRADEAGVDVVEIHAAHGYLLHEFLSPLANKRTDHYGGSLENRLRLLLEIITLTRSTLSPHKPVFLRISATDSHIEGEKNERGEYISWGMEQSKVLLKKAVELGIALVDVSSSGIDVKQKIEVGPGYQVPFATELRHSLHPSDRIPISTVGLITSGHQAEAILQSGQADVITVAREFLRHADLVFDWAQELGVSVNVPVQYQRAQTRMLKMK